jgi:tetratricopeptide (TPR) repeat protein
LSRAGAEAAAAGLLADATRAFWALMVMRHEGGDFASARAVSVKAAEVARASTPAVAAAQMANSACCLLELEHELPSARAWLHEAKALAETNGIDVPDVWLGLGLLALHEGDPDAARPLLERALAIAESQGDAWRRFWASRRLAMIDLEAGRFDSAQARACTMAELAEKLGDGSEAAMASAFDGAARWARAEPEGREALERGLLRLREVDAKKMLGQLLVFRTPFLLERGDEEAARRFAEEALRAAEELGAANLSALANVALGDAALARGDIDRAAAHAAAAVGAPFAGPEVPSARTLSLIAGLEQRLASATKSRTSSPRGKGVSTEAPTQAPTLEREARRRR